jgi:hypothetical protein
MIGRFKLVLDYHDLIPAHIVGFYIDGEISPAVFATNDLKVKAKYRSEDINMLKEPGREVKGLMFPDASRVDAKQRPKFGCIHDVDNIAGCSGKACIAER